MSPTVRQIIIASRSGWLNSQLIFVGVVLVATVWWLRDSLPSAKKPLASYADTVVKACQNEPYRPSCYDREIPKLVDVLSLEEGFAVTRIVQEKDASYQYCHVLGHALSARETRQNPDKWKEVLGRCPSGLCSNGCLHGGLQERFRGQTPTGEELEAVIVELATLCEKRPGFNPTGLEQASCYHALGHLLMYLTDGDVEQATAFCEQVANKADGRDFRHLCYDGNFMQIFQPLEPEDFVLVQGITPAKDKLASFCRNFSADKREACWRESWPLYRNEVTTPAGLVSFCNQAGSPAAQTRCFSGMFYVLTSQFNFDEEQIISFCTALPKDRQGQCFANAASRFIETDYRNIDRAVALCQRAQAYGQHEACYQELVLYSTYNFQAESDEFFSLCRRLPKPWQNQCLKKSEQ